MARETANRELNKLERKGLIGYRGTKMVLGSTIVGAVPMFLGADLFSFWPLIRTLVGGFAGIYLALKISGNN